jgi:hypothetical protein
VWQCLLFAEDPRDRDSAVKTGTSPPTRMSKKSSGGGRGAADGALRTGAGTKRKLIRPIRRGVSKGVGDCCRPPALRAGHPRNGRKAVSAVARLQSVEGSGMAGPEETLGSPWIPLAIRAWN